MATSLTVADYRGKWIELRIEELLSRPSQGLRLQRLSFAHLEYEKKLFDW